MNRNAINTWIKYGLIIIALLIGATSAIYIFNDRIIKFYEKEPYPLFDSDFTSFDTKLYLSDDPASKYPDFSFGPIYNISDYGAIDSYYDKDGKIDQDIIKENTKAINEAIKDASENKGVLLIPEGDFVSGTIKLKSNMTLRIEGNLIGSRSKEDYDPTHFIVGDSVRNVTIEGKGGKIMGEGEYFWNNPILKPLESIPNVSDLRMLQLNHFLCKRDKQSNRPSPFILFTESRDIVVRNVIVNNSPGWTLAFELSNHINIRDLVIHNNIRGGNVDGIDIVATSNVIIDNVLVSTADDGIVLKNPKFDNSVDMSNVTIRNATISTTTNAFKVGTETYSDIENIRFEDSSIETTQFFPGAISGIAVESVDGSAISDVYVNNITMKGVLAPLFIRLGNRNKYGGKDLQSSISNITINNIFSEECQLPSIISGVSHKGVILTAKNIQINNFQVKYLDTKERLLLPSIVSEAPEEYPDVWMFGDVPAYGIYIRHAEVDYKKVDITPRSVNTREMIVFDEGSVSEEHLLFAFFLIIPLISLSFIVLMKWTKYFSVFLMK